MASSFIARLARAWPAPRWRDRTVAVAVSGGADSVALLRGLCELRAGGSGRLIVAHCHHQLRGDAADADATFVDHLAKSLGLPCEIGRTDVSAIARRQGDGIEAAARQARYAFLIDIAQRQAAQFVVMAHTVDDQVETILHRIIRGTGLTGLAGMPRRRTLVDAITLVRPLLTMRRRQGLTYLCELGQDFRVDESNLDRRMTRNRLRNELLPLLARDYNPRVGQALLRLARLSAETNCVIRIQAERLADQLAVSADPQRLVVSRSTEAGVDSHLFREALRILWQRQGWPEQSMSDRKWRELAQLALVERPEPRIRMFPGALRAERRGDELIVTLYSTGPSTPPV